MKNKFVLNKSNMKNRETSVKFSKIILEFFPKKYSFVASNLFIESYILV